MKMGAEGARKFEALFGVKLIKIHQDLTDSQME